MSKRLCFILRASPGAFFEIDSRFRPNGRLALNSTEWRGKEPRSCAVTGLKSRPHAPGSPTEFEIEVSYRPNGYISYTGHTRYDGWDAMVLNPDSDPPAYERREMYDDIEFNDLDFGEFVGELDAPGVQHVTHDAVMEQLAAGMRGGFSSSGSFMAPHRSRPMRKIILSSQPTGQGVDGFGTQVLNINSSTPNLDLVLADAVTQLMCDFLEGKASIKSMGNDDFTFVEVADSFVDCGPNEDGLPSWFGMLHLSTRVGFLEDLAKRLMAVYAIQVAMVDGENGGLVLRREAT
jgi:hypothetical protein